MPGHARKLRTHASEWAFDLDPSPLAAARELLSVFLLRKELREPARRAGHDIQSGGAPPLRRKLREEVGRVAAACVHLRAVSIALAAVGAEFGNVEWGVGVQGFAHCPA